MKLYNNIEIPDVGLGTWLIDNDKVTDVIKNAVEIGYRHIDTAQAYENEEGIGVLFDFDDDNFDSWHQPNKKPYQKILSLKNIK